MNITRIIPRFVQLAVAAGAITVGGSGCVYIPKPHTFEDAQTRYAQDSVNYIKNNPYAAALSSKLLQMMKERDKHILNHYGHVPNISLMTMDEVQETLTEIDNEYGTHFWEAPDYSEKSWIAYKIAAMGKHNISWYDSWKVSESNLEYGLEYGHMLLYKYAFEDDIFVTKISEEIFKTQKQLKVADGEFLENSRNYYNYHVKSSINNSIVADNDIKKLKKELSYLRDKLFSIDYHISCGDASPAEREKRGKLIEDISELQSKIKTMRETKKDEQQKIYRAKLESEIEALQTGKKKFRDVEPVKCE